MEVTHCVCNLLLLLRKSDNCYAVFNSADRERHYG